MRKALVLYDDKELLAYYRRNGMDTATFPGSGPPPLTASYTEKFPLSVSRK